MEKHNLLQRISNLGGRVDPIRKKRNTADKSTYMLYSNIEKTIGFMKESYAEDSGKFFEKYGSVVGTYSLVEDMTAEHPINVNLRNMHWLIKDGSEVSEMMGIQDERFDTFWDPGVIMMAPREINAVKSLVSPVFSKDPDKFYQLYGSELSPVILAQQLRDKRFLDVSPSRLSSMLTNPKIAQTALGIDDKDFLKKWNVKSCFGNSSDYHTAIANLKKEYSSDPDNFFARYGSPEGVYNLGLKAFENKGDEDDVSLEAVSRIMKNGPLLEGILGVDDSRFSTSWEPKDMSMSISHSKYVVDFLKETHKKDPDSFFERYGSKIGIYHAMKDLNANEDKPKGKFDMAIRPLLMSGSQLSRLIGVEDPRFLTSWNPKSTTLNESQTDSVKEFLSKKYTENADSFFDRYGANFGLPLLSQDLEEEGVKLGPYRLTTLVKDAEAVRLLLGKKDSRFDTSWNPRSIQIKGGSIPRIADFLKESHDSDPIRFFVRYGGNMGHYFMQKDLNKEIGINVPTNQLGSLVGQSRLVSKLTGIPEEEFEGRWNAHSIGISSKNIEKVRDFLLEEYKSDSEAFFDTYGSPSGVIPFSQRLKKVKNVKSNTFHLSRILKNGSSVETLLGVDDERFRTNWNVKSIETSSKQLGPVINHLKNVYTENPDMFFYRYGAEEGVYNVASDLEKKGALVGKDMWKLSNLLERKIIQGALGIEDERFRTNWDPRQIKLNRDDFKGLMSHLKKQYESDPDIFFEKYSSPLRTPILLGEMQKSYGSAMNPEKVASAVLTGNFVSKVLDVDDSRFDDSWRNHVAGGIFGINLPGSKYSDLRESAVTGVRRIGDGISLENLDTVLNKNDLAYAKFRYSLRMGSLNTAKHIVDLFGGEDKEIAIDNIGASIEKDHQMMEDFKQITGLAEADEKEEQFSKQAGLLNYSFDENIRKAAVNHMMSVYAPLFHMNAWKSNESGKIWDNFTRYCERFDMFGLYWSHRRKRREGYTLKKGISSLLTQSPRWIAAAKAENNEISLDAQIGKDEDNRSTGYEVLQ